MNKIKTVKLELVGPRFICYSPFAALEIADGQDYLETSFESPAQVEKEALKGRIVGVSTGSPGAFEFEIFFGYPSDQIVDENQYKLRLCVEVRDRKLYIRDLFDLMDWSSNCPQQHTIDIDDGFYHITLLSRDPPSGVLGDNQKILMYLQKLDELPILNIRGVPTLC
jgi:hypothetical protein